METHEFVVQTRLGPEKKKDYYIFPKDVVIWPQGFRRRGVLTADLQARKEEGKEVRGYQAWVAEGEAHLYFNRKPWQISSGSRFGAPVASARKRSV